MELELYGYYEITSGGVCKIIDMNERSITYVVYGRDGKRLPTITLQGSQTCLRKEFEKVVVRRVKPRAKPPKLKVPKLKQPYYNNMPPGLTTWRF